MDKINWNKFCSTGNIKCLDNLSDNTKNIVKKYINRNVRYKGLQRILELYFNNSIKNIKHCNFITLIKSISYHTSTRYNKQIYVFGEFHNSVATCKIDKCNVYEFILNNILNIPKFIDLFLETPYTTKGIKEIPKTKGLLGKFETDFKDCLIFEKEKCNYPNIRFHNTDIRQAQDKTSDILLNIHDYLLKIGYAYKNNDLEYFHTLIHQFKVLLKDKQLSFKSHEELLIYIY